MSAVKEVIIAKQSEKGWTTAELSRRSGVNYQNLWASLKGKRNIPAPEFVSLCKVLELDVCDFPVETK